MDPKNDLFNKLTYPLYPSNLFFTVSPSRRLSSFLETQYPHTHERMGNNQKEARRILKQIIFLFHKIPPRDHGSDVRFSEQKFQDLKTISLYRH